MSDIKKNLILSAKLDTSGLDLKKIKKDLSPGLDLDTASLNSLKTEFSKIAEEFGKELKAALKSVKASDIKIGVGAGRASKAKEPTANDFRKWNQQSLQRDEIRRTKEQAQEQRAFKKKEAELESFRKLARQGNDKAAQQQPEEQRKQIEWLAKQREQQEKANAPKVDRELEKFRQLARSGNDRAITQQPHEQKTHQKWLKDQKKAIAEAAKYEERMRMSALKRWGEDLKGFVKEGNTDFLKGGAGRGLGGRGLLGSASRGLSGIGGAGAGGMALRGLGLAGLAVGATAFAANKAADVTLDKTSESRAVRAELADREFETARGVSQNRILETAVRERTREDGLGGIEKFAAGTKGFFKDVFNPNQWGKDFGTGITAAISEREKQEGDVRVAEQGPLFEAIQNNLLPRMQNRVELMAGGNLSSGDITNRVKQGTTFGFNQDEVLDQMRAAREHIGNKALSGPGGIASMGIMMQNRRNLGVSAGLQAQAADTFRSFSDQGSDVRSSLVNQQSVMKKAIAAGLDASKTSKFLEATSNYVSSASGMGALDVNEINDNLATFAKGIAESAGRDDITTPDIERALKVQQTLKQESMAQGGFAGVGNIVGVLEAAKQSGINLSTDDLLAARGLSSEATQDQIMRSVDDSGATDAQRKKFAEILESTKNDTFGFGAKTLGMGKATGFRAMELGLPTEQVMGLEDATKNRARIQDEISTKMRGQDTPIVSGDEMTNLINQAKTDFENFEAAFKKLPEINEKFGNQLLKLTESLEKASARVEETFNSGGATTRTPAPQRPAHNLNSESEAATPRYTPSLGGR